MPFAAVLATLLFTLQPYKMSTVLARCSFFWAAALCIHSAVAAASASAPSNSLHIFRCPQPLELWITLENLLERRSFPGYVCGDAQGKLSLQSIVDAPEHHAIIDGNYRKGPGGLNLTLHVKRQLPDDKAAEWSFSGDSLASNGKPNALSRAPGADPGGADVKLIVAISPIKASSQIWLGMDVENVPAGEIVRKLAAIPGLSIQGIPDLKHAPLWATPITLHFSIINAQSVLGILADVCQCEFQRLSAGVQQIRMPRDGAKLAALILALNEATDATYESTSADDPAWTTLIAQLEAIRTLTRPRGAADVAPSANQELLQLARLYDERGAKDLGVAVLRDVLSDAQHHDLRPNASSVANARALLGAALLRTGKAREAKQQLEQAAGNLDLTSAAEDAPGVLKAYAKLGMTDVTSAQLRELLHQLEAFPEIDNAKIALLLAMAIRDGTDAPSYDADNDPVIAVFTRWVADGVGNERMDGALFRSGLVAYINNDYAAAAHYLSVESMVRVNARLVPDSTEVQVHEALVVSQVMLGDYARAARALERLIGLELAWHKPEAIINSAALRDLRLLYTAANDTTKASQTQAQLLASIQKQSLPRRSMPALDSELSDALKLSVFPSVRAAQTSARASAKTTQARITVEDALILAQLAARDYAGAQAAFIATQAGSAKARETRAAWFARVKEFAMAASE